MLNHYYINKYITNKQKVSYIYKNKIYIYTKFCNVNIFYKYVPIIIEDLIIRNPFNIIALFFALFFK